MDAIYRKDLTQVTNVAMLGTTYILHWPMVSAESDVYITVSIEKLCYFPLLGKSDNKNTRKSALFSATNRTEWMLLFTNECSWIDITYFFIAKIEKEENQRKRITLHFFRIVIHVKLIYIQTTCFSVSQKTVFFWSNKHNRDVVPEDKVICAHYAYVGGDPLLYCSF